MVEASTKKQLIEFITNMFVTPEGEHPSASSLEEYKKSDLVQFLVDSGLEGEFTSYISSFNN